MVQLPRPYQFYFANADVRPTFFLINLRLRVTALERYTVEPPNKGQVGTYTDVRYSEVVLYWGVFAKNPLFYIFIRCISFFMI